MELKFSHQTHEGYLPTFFSVWKQEETTESIIPDSLPDVSRVISAQGTVCMTEKVCGDRHAQISGKACITVIYIADGEENPRSLVVEIPFRTRKDDPEIGPDAVMHTSSVLSYVDARILNPRKLLIRSEIMFEASVYSYYRYEVNHDMLSSKPELIEKQNASLEYVSICEISEKTFQFSDVWTPSSTKPEISEMICARAEFGTLEGKLIGKKLVCKGDIRFEVIYRSEQELCSAQFEIPYSQVIETGQTYEDGEVSLVPALNSIELQSGNGTVEANVELTIQCCIRAVKSCCYLKDCYGIGYQLSPERENYPIIKLLDMQMRKEQVRAFCELNTPARQILSCIVTPGSFQISESEDSSVCEAQYNISLLYFSEDGALCSASCKTSVSVNAPLSPHMCIYWSCRPAGEAVAVPVSGGAEVRFHAEFLIAGIEESSIQAICAVNASPNTDAGKTPSLMVRTAGPGETVWDIAKSCGAAVRDINEVNCISGETLEVGRILLIPTKRIG